MKKAPAAITLVLALALGGVAPVAAHPRSGPPGQASSGGNPDAEETVFATADGCTLAYVSNGRVVRSLVVNDDCEAPWFVHDVTACLPNGTRTEPVRLYVHRDSTVTTRHLRELSLHPATRFGGVPGGAAALDEIPEEPDRWIGGHAIVDADGVLHDNTTEVVFEPLDRVQRFWGEPGEPSYVVHTDRKGVIRGLDLENPTTEFSDGWMTYVIEFRLRDGTYSQVYSFFVPPDTDVTIERGILNELGIRNAVGIGDSLREGVDVPDSDFPERATVFDEDGNVIQLQEREREIPGCFGGIT